MHPAGVPADAEIVQEGIQAAPGHVGVEVGIPAAVEQERRISGDPSTRYMHDIDFSILELDRLDRAYRHLLETGLALVTTKAKRSRPEATYYHYPALVDRVTGIEIELHKQPFRGISDTLLGLFRAGLAETAVDGARVMLPSREFRFLHTVIHAQESGKSIYHAYFNPRYLVEGLEFLQAMSEAERRRITSGTHGYGIYLGSWLVLLERFLSPPFETGFEPGLVHGLQYRRIVRRGGFPPIRPGSARFSGDFSRRRIPI